MSILNIELVKKHIKVDGNDEDTEIQIYIEAAEQYVNDFCDTKDEPFAVFPAPVQAAVLLIVGDLYENREMQVVKELYQNPAAENLLLHYRKF